MTPLSRWMETRPAHRLKRMKDLIFLATFPLAGAVAAPLTLPADISTVVSVDGKYDPKHSNAVRERFVVRNALGAEGSQAIVLEKYAPGRNGSEDQVIISRTFFVAELPGVKEHLADKAAEAAYGCCSIENIKKSGTAWTFQAKQGAKSFKCRSEETVKRELAISCSK